jgi:hypothetical protein
MKNSPNDLLISELEEIIEILTDDNIEGNFDINQNYVDIVQEDVKILVEQVFLVQATEFSEKEKENINLVKSIINEIYILLDN